MIELPSSLPDIVHGTAVVVAGQGALVMGPSGSGKSSLALQLMAYGAGLISDDLVQLEDRDGAIWASRPPTVDMPLQIEARGMGLLSAHPAPPAPIAVIIDLSECAQSRLPQPISLRIGNQDVRCLHKVDTPAYPAMILQYLSAASKG